MVKARFIDTLLLLPDVGLLAAPFVQYARLYPVGLNTEGSRVRVCSDAPQTLPFTDASSSVRTFVYPAFSMQLLYAFRRRARPNVPPPPTVGNSAPLSSTIFPLDFSRQARWVCWSWAFAPDHVSRVTLAQPVHDSIRTR
jgi:hypothetical protein